MQSYRWDKHGNDILRRMAEFYENEKYVDCTFVVEGRKIRAHKVILCASSSYFQELLNSASREGVITLKNVNFNDLSNILNFVYFGAVDIPLNEVTSFIKTTQLLEINGINKFDEMKVEEEFLSDKDQENPVVKEEILSDDNQDEPEKQHEENQPEDGVEVKEEILSDDNEDESEMQHEENQPEDGVKDSDLQPICSVTIPVYNEREEVTIKTEKVDCDLDDAEEAEKAAEEEDSGGRGDSEVLSQFYHSSEVRLTNENPSSFLNVNKLKAQISSRMAKQQIQELPLSSDGKCERSDTLMVQSHGRRIGFPNESTLHKLHNHTSHDLVGESGSGDIMPNRFLEIHMESHTEQEIHMESHTEQDILMESLTEQGPLERELRQKHAVAQKAKSNLYICNVCGTHFDRKRDLKLHSVLHSSKSKIYTCEICGTGFTKWGTLVTHTYKKHPGKDGPKWEVYTCKICGKKFSKKGPLVNHIYTNHGYSCRVCNQRFRKYLQLKKHVLRHSERPYKCEVCQKGFVYQNNMEKHLLTHADVKIYECNVCNKQYRTFSNYEKHMRTHSSEMPHKCVECLHCFPLASDLELHTKSHESEQPQETDSV